ncbi:L,D-transpeptidase family protein [Tranquillimonas alkanivorans]|uniref:L,D-transpeptidase catalytic domain n=1 Tax=Tranquillimonas alkanivorans TaxID=441119 RepID=A0A1I5LFL6_9RHOB|nr:L,D-transpeptidase family protein [Tranquillimonas alkanivorans]SFO95973.1 L,D-transpeptidase catalytic domain [Tranquillimonas alkanivorans]
MRFLRALGLLALVVTVAGCGGSKFRTYDGPEVTRIHVLKGQRQLLLMHGPYALKAYEIGLGWAPEGDKQVEGDGRTPEGHYLIDKRNPNSKYHLSIGISYPDPRDMAEAQALGFSPGGDIFIHGRGPSYERGSPRDWTWGCIAVTDDEIEEIYAMVKDGTPISIHP